MKKDYVASLGDAAAWPPGGVSCPDAHDGNSVSSKQLGEKHHVSAPSQLLPLVCSL